MDKFTSLINKEIEIESSLNRLEILDAKTGNSYMKCGRVCRMKTGGRVRILGEAHGSQYYHVMSRTAGGDYLMEAEEKEAFRKIMRRMAKFSGVQVLTWVAMDNHFHILARVPEKKTYLQRFEDVAGEPEGAGEERLIRHLSCLYSDAYISRLRAELADFRKRGMEDQVERFLEKFKRRFCDITLYIKEVKERFSRWYNKKHQRKGTLWMSRFKSVLVEDGVALRTMSAYIDLNPVRAEMVEDPKDYRWCGYAEAVAGVREAGRGLCRVMAKPVDSWDEHGSWYRCWLMIDGEDVAEDKAHHVKARKGISKEKVKAELENLGRLSVGQQLLSRVAYFTEGWAIGGQSFIETIFLKNREKFGPERVRSAKPIGMSVNLVETSLRSDVDAVSSADACITDEMKSEIEKESASLKLPGTLVKKMYSLQGAIGRE